MPRTSPQSSGARVGDPRPTRGRSSVFERRCPLVISDPLNLRSEVFLRRDVVSAVAVASNFVVVSGSKPLGPHCPLIGHDAKWLGAFVPFMGVSTMSSRSGARSTSAWRTPSCLRGPWKRARLAGASGHLRPEHVKHAQT